MRRFKQSQAEAEKHWLDYRAEMSKHQGTFLKMWLARASKPRDVFHSFREEKQDLRRQQQAHKKERHELHRQQQAHQKEKDDLYKQQQAHKKTRDELYRQQQAHKEDKEALAELLYNITFVAFYIWSQKFSQ